MAKMKERDYSPEDESQSQWALRAERNKRKGQMSQNNFGHNVGFYSFFSPSNCSIPEVPVGALGSIGSRMEMCWK